MFLPALKVVFTMHSKFSVGGENPTCTFEANEPRSVAFKDSRGFICVSFFSFIGRPQGVKNEYLPSDRCTASIPRSSAGRIGCKLFTRRGAHEGTSSPGAGFQGEDLPCLPEGSGLVQKSGKQLGAPGWVQR